MYSTKKRKIFIISIIIIIFIMSMTSIGIYGRYIKNKQYDKNQTYSDDYYFTIDLLGNTQDLDSLSKDIHLYGGDEQTIKFIVRNYFDNIRINEEKIDYYILLETSIPNVVLTNGENVISGQTNYSLSGGSLNSEQYVLSVPKDGYTEGQTIKITVSSNKPYNKTMILNFILHINVYDLQYYVIDSELSSYAELVIMSNIAIPANSIVIDWFDVNNDGLTNNLQIDCTNINILEPDLTWGINNPKDSFLSKAIITRNMAAIESISIYFFKSDKNKNYSTEKDEILNYISIGVEKSLDNTYTITLKEKGDSE